ncbi:MAG: hypothetical protein QG588_1796 [Candidatus Poribacteria bacterium]|nr:hypothetical protein [Candidatus Poribacteria bacterium]
MGKHKHHIIYNKNNVTSDTDIYYLEQLIEELKRTKIQLKKDDQKKIDLIIQEIISSSSREKKKQKIIPKIANWLLLSVIFALIIGKFSERLLIGIALIVGVISIVAFIIKANSDFNLSKAVQKYSDELQNIGHRPIHHNHGT